MPRPSSAPATAQEPTPRPTLERRRLRLADGSATTLHVARFARSTFVPRVRVVEPVSTVRRWCELNGAEHAIVGGFYLRPGGPALGDLWIGGEAVPSEPFDPPWHRARACIQIDGRRVTLAPRRELGVDVHGDLLQAGPMLVAGGRPLIRDGVDCEGFSAGARQFDSDITIGRYPRSALGLSKHDLIAVVCDGRADDEAGLTLEELARLMAALGAAEAMNLDGGGSASLVIDGSLINVPREEHGLQLVDGREVATVLELAAGCGAA
jgi:phosphodiester glycosidase